MNIAMTREISAPIFSAVGGAVRAIAGAGARKYMATPLASTGLMLIVSMSAFTAHNALFSQQAEHPNPFFFGAERIVANAPRVVAPVPNPAIDRQKLLNPVAPTPQEIDRQVVSAIETILPKEQNSVKGTVTNEMLSQVQQRLKSWGMFDDKVDGYYGPNTAKAIRAFETRMGLKPTGALEYGVMQQVLQTNALPQQLNTQASAVTAPEPNLQQLIENTQLEPASAEVAVAEVVVASEASTGTGHDAVAALLTNARNEALKTVEPTNPVPSNPVAQEQADIKLAAITPEMTDEAYTRQVQKALASMAFLLGEIDGVAGEETAKAIRSFEVFHNYEVTGRVTPELLDMLLTEGATIE